MSAPATIPRQRLISLLRDLGFEGPEGSRHDFMKRDSFKLIPHGHASRRAYSRSHRPDRRSGGQQLIVKLSGALGPYFVSTTSGTRASGAWSGTAAAITVTLLTIEAS